MPTSPPPSPSMISMLRPPDRRVRWVSLGVAVGAHLLLGVAAYVSVITREAPPPGLRLTPLSAERAPVLPPPKPILRVVHRSEPVIQVALPDPRPDEPEPIMIEDDELVIVPDDLPAEIGDWTSGAEAPPPPGPLLIGPDMIPPRIIAGTRVQPDYPEAARKAGIEGDVLLRAIIHRDGTVGALEVVQVPRLDLGFSEAALAAVAQWRYHPALLEGRPVEVYFTIAVGFRFDD